MFKNPQISLNPQNMSPGPNTPIFVHNYENVRYSQNGHTPQHSQHSQNSKMGREKVSLNRYTSSGNISRISQEKLDLLKNNSEIFKQSPLNNYNSKYSNLRVPQNIGISYLYPSYSKQSIKGLKPGCQGSRINKTQGMVFPRNCPPTQTKPKARNRPQHLYKNTNHLRVKGSHSFLDQQRYA